MTKPAICARRAALSLVLLSAMLLCFALPSSPQAQPQAQLPDGDAKQTVQNA